MKSQKIDLAFSQCDRKQILVVLKGTAGLLWVSGIDALALKATASVYIYIYIYIYRERERERVCVCVRYTAFSSFSTFY